MDTGGGQYLRILTCGRGVEVQEGNSAVDSNYLRWIWPGCLEKSNVIFYVNKPIVFLYPWHYQHGHRSRCHPILVEGCWFRNPPWEKRPILLVYKPVVGHVSQWHVKKGEDEDPFLGELAFGLTSRPVALLYLVSSQFPEVLKLPIAPLVRLDHF
jgi:hypothetical protein